MRCENGILFLSGPIVKKAFETACGIKITRSGQVFPNYCGETATGCLTVDSKPLLRSSL